MTNAVIFDMDGVLIDSQPLHYEIDILVLTACGYHAQMTDVVSYTGQSNPDRWPKYKAAHNLPQTVPELIEMVEAQTRVVFNNAPLVAIDGILELLQWLRGKGFHIGIASSSSQELIGLVLAKTGIAHFFDAITSGEDVARSKPHPDVYLCAAKKANVPPEACYAIEDAPLGILAAKNAGCTCIAYTNPSTHGQVFDNADYVIKHFNQVLEIILCK